MKEDEEDEEAEPEASAFNPKKLGSK